jgi:LETM1 and EF-hand domain-containing protein 1, mitochondrial
LPPKLSALAIVVPQRSYATETTSHGSESGPPPGFNINEAKKPLPKEESQKASSSAPTISELKKSEEQLRVPRTSATATAKTEALENATLSELAAEKSSPQSGKESSTDVATKKEESKKLTLGQKIKKEVQHYWDGTKLLAAEVKISTKLAFKMAAGYELSRRENRQVSTCSIHESCCQITD